MPRTRQARRGSPSTLCLQACCEPDASGAYVINCNPDCKDDCDKKTWAKAESLAQAHITATESTNVATCTGSLRDHLTHSASAFHVDMSDYKWDGSADLTCAESQAKCESFAQGDAVATAVSDTAAKSKDLARAFCKVPYGADKVEVATAYNTAEGLAEVIAKVRAPAARRCAVAAVCNACCAMPRAPALPCVPQVLLLPPGGPLLVERMCTLGAWH